MGKRAKSWSFDQQVREAERALRGNDSLDAHVKFFEESFSDSNRGPHNLGPLFQMSLGVTYWHEALLKVEKTPNEAWERIHLVWRGDALTQRVHLERLTQMARDFPDRHRRGRLGIASIDYDFLGQMLLSVAFSTSLGEDEAAWWLGDRLVQLAVNHDTITNSNMLTTGYTEPFLFRLYCAWRRQDVDLSELGVKDYGPFRAFFDRWHNAAAIEAATLELCRLHASKSANVDREDSDLVFGLQSGPFQELPVEILFLQRVRRDLGLSVPNPEHPLLRSPLMRIPYPCPRSGFDPYLHRVYTKCKEMMPYLTIPWEEEIGRQKHTL